MRKRRRYQRRRTELLAYALALGTATVGLGVLPTAPAAAASPAYAITAGQLSIGLTDTGQVDSLLDVANGTDYVAAPNGQDAYLIQLIANGARQLPTGLTYDSSASTYTFAFSGLNIQVGVQVESKPTYATFDVTSVNAPSGVDVETLLWGPVATSISKTVGESVGVARDDGFAIGIHELNNKTVGGWPFEDDAYGYSAAVAGPNEWGPDWSSAYKTTWGSALQAYTYDYTQTRYRTTGWPGSAQETDVPAPPLTGSDAVIPGSEIALFGTTPDQVPDVISSIETDNGLPHPTINGQWQKTAQAASQSFLVLSDLASSNVAQASQYANEAGINYVYSLVQTDGPWVSAGHYKFNSSFGGSDAGMAAAVQTAASYGVNVGVHTLSDFIDPGDPYVTPTPDPGLAQGGTATLTRVLNSADTAIYVNSNTPFTNGGLGTLVEIGNEIATYSTVTQISSTEWELSGGTRHVWGTTAAASDPVGTTVARLVGNEYGGAVGGLPLVNSLATRLSTMLNDTGVKAMSFDGAESASQTPYGLYASAQMIDGTYDGMTSKDGTITEGSNIYPGTWDAQSRVSWGEAANGTTMQQVYANQDFYQRNYLPDMMGWLDFNAGNSTLQQEWQDSKAASWNAGTDLQTSVGTLNAAGNTAAVLGEFNQWETARNLGAFTQAQQAEMRNLSSYWHLANVIPDQLWDLYPIAFPATPLSQAYNGSSVNWQYTNSYAAQPMQFQLKASGGSIVDPSFTAGSTTMTFDITVPSGDYLMGNGTATATLYDSTWHTLGTVTASSVADLSAGTQTVSYDSSGSTGATSQVWIITQGPAQTVVAPDLAQSATATASSHFQGYPGDPRYLPGNANDGLPATQWASQGQLDPSITLTWSTPQTISAMSFSDRDDGVDLDPGGTLTFSDGSHVTVTGIPSNGSSYTVTFPARTVTSVTYQVVGGSGQNVGLQEIGAYGPPPLNFGPLQPADVARTATVTASSYFQGYPGDPRYLPGNAVDGLVGTQWASQGELDPWITLTWPTPQTISGMAFNDRDDGVDFDPGGTLTFSDGSTVTVSGIPANGSTYTVNFPARTVTSVTYQVVGGSGSNVGLQEIQALAAPDLAESATATASSYFQGSPGDTRYLPSKAIDGDSSTDWASQGQVDPWITLTWSTPRTISEMTFADRDDGVDFDPGGTLTFSDGSTVTVSGIPANGSPLAVTFPSRTVTSVTYQVVGGSGSNVGLQEIQAFQ